MKGSVYCVLFTDGTLKAGVTFGEPHKRLRTHVSSGKSFGLQVEAILFTEMHDGAEKTESAILDYLRKKLPARTAEYFSDADFDTARSAMLRTGCLTAWSDSIKVQGDCLLVPPAINFNRKEKSNEDQNTLKLKIARLINNNKDNGVTKGVIQNRFRSQVIDFALFELIEEGKISLEVTSHAKNSMQIERYWPCYTKQRHTHAYDA